MISSNMVAIHSDICAFGKRYVSSVFQNIAPIYNPVCFTHTSVQIIVKLKIFNTKEMLLNIVAKLN